GAISRGVDSASANSVFDKVAKFVGFGFCRSHAAAFAKTVYQSAYLKRFHPAAYMASVLQYHPGMYPRMTLEEEARRFGVTTLLPDINRSSVLHDLERIPTGSLAIRKPLTSVAEVSAEDAREIIWERLAGPFKSVEDFYTRVSIHRDTIDNLARSGALDGLARGSPKRSADGSETDSRTALWEVGVLSRKLGQPGTKSAQQRLFAMPILSPDDIPSLPDLTPDERISWDFMTHRAGRVHPMTLARRSLQELEIRPIETCYRFPTSGQARGRLSDIRRPTSDVIITTAGIVILRQRPPTAKGFMFVTIEDETGFIQCVVPPQAQEHLDHVLTASGLIVRGSLQTTGNWRGLILQQAWILNGIFGGYEGFAGTYGGRDQWIRQPAPVYSEATTTSAGYGPTRPDNRASRTAHPAQPELG
ncbi:MAG: OB-fold nucleic acid binding domain-containing protein, partial [Rhodothermia bacterium]